MSFEMNMLTMYHVHLLGTEMEGKKTRKVPKSRPKNKNQTSPKYNCRISRLTVKIIQFSSCGQIYDMHNMAEIEKGGLGFTVVCHLIAREFI